MKSPYLTLIALALFATLSTQTLGDNDLIAEKWQCFDILDWNLDMLGLDNKKEAVIELTREKFPQGQTWGAGEVSTGGIVQPARFQIDGLEKRWNFGNNFRYSFFIGPNGDGAYHDFSMAEPGETTKPSALYKCVSRK